MPQMSGVSLRSLFAHTGLPTGTTSHDVTHCPQVPAGTPTTSLLNSEVRLMGGSGGIYIYGVTTYIGKRSFQDQRFFPYITSLHIYKQLDTHGINIRVEEE